MKSTIKAGLVSVLVFSVISIYAQSQAPAPVRKPDIKRKDVSYTIGGTVFKGYIAYDASIKGKRPGILVIPEWWGVDAYVRKRADMLAGLGYTAMAVDMYGGGKQVTAPDEAKSLTAPFYQESKLGKIRIDAAERELKKGATVDDQQIGIIGYCFGGAMALNAAKMGADYKATVSFHGGLDGVQAAKGSVKGKILVCHGAADKFVSATDVAKFRRNLDSVGASYSFKVYEGATHAFTNPQATANGKKFNMPIAYNEKADKQSWADMTEFLKSIFTVK